MHITHLALGPDVIVSCLLDWTDTSIYVGGDSRDKRLTVLWSSYRRFCEAFKIQERAQRRLWYTELWSSKRKECDRSLLLSWNLTVENIMSAPTRTFAHDDILWTWTHGGCCATAGVGWGGVGMMTLFELEQMVDATHTWWMLRNCWGGVGRGWWHSLNLNTWWMWGGLGMMTFFGLEHMVDAAQLLGWGGVGWGRDDDILWTWTHGGCYAHMVDATQLLGWGGVGWGGDDDILWTWTHGGCGVGWGWWHGGCCATAGVGWGGVGMMTFFELEHMVDATQLLGWGGVVWAWWHSLNLNTWWMLRNCGMMTFFELEHMVDATQLCFSCHCTHAGCYATAFAFAWDVENASKLEEAEERTAWYEPCQEKKGPSVARAKVRVAANIWVCPKKNPRCRYMLFWASSIARQFAPPFWPLSFHEPDETGGQNANWRFP